jgi:hypothetical protein
VVQAVVFHGTGCRVTHLYFLFLWQQIELQILIAVRKAQEANGILLYQSLALQLQLFIWNGNYIFN